MEDIGTRGNDRWSEQERNLRQVIEQEGEDLLERYAAERGMDFHRLVLANLYFEKAVPQNAVFRIVYRYLRQGKTGGDCFQDNPREFSIILFQPDEELITDTLAQMREVLQGCMDMPVYLGVSRMAGDCIGMLLEGRRELEMRGFDIAGAGLTERTLLEEMYRQAAAARENRRFFGKAGCMSYEKLWINESGGKPDGSFIDFGQSVKTITTCLLEKRYDSAMRELEWFLGNMKEADHFHPAYVHALGNRILSAYIHETRTYSLDEDERKDVNGIELWLGWQTRTLEEMSRALLRLAVFLDDLMDRKSGKDGCSPAVRQAIRYMRENYERELSLEEVSGYVHLSRAYLSTLFKRETGIRFSEYLLEIRMEHVRRLLADPEIPVHEVADRTGFFDAAHLSRVFRRQHGCSPVEYRRRAGRKERE